MIRRKTLNVSGVEHPARNYAIIEIEDPGLASESRPGMFCELRAPSQKDRLFKPISVFHAADDRLSFLIKLIGPGTLALGNLKEGDGLELIGPLGNGFPVFEGRNVLLVSGGVGYPPLAWLKKVLARTNQVLHLHGGAGKDDIFECDLSCTVNGTLGHQGLVTDLVPDLIRARGIDLVYSCGPVPMLRKLATLCAGVEHYASLEAYMACGVGVCYGCAIPVGETYQRVCKEGPVFDASLIKWEEL